MRRKFKICLFLSAALSIGMNCHADAKLVDVAEHSFETYELSVKESRYFEDTLKEQIAKKYVSEGAVSFFKYKPGNFEKRLQKPMLSHEGYDERLAEAYIAEVFGKSFRELKENEWQTVLNECFSIQKIGAKDVYVQKTMKELFDEARRPKLVLNKIDYDYYKDTKTDRFSPHYQSQVSYENRMISYGSSTIGESGCGPAVIAVLINILNGKNDIKIADAAQWSEQHHKYVAGYGTKWSFIEEFAGLYGFRAEACPKGNAQKLMETLESDVPSVMVMKKGFFTDGGHFVLAYKENGKVRIIDPASYYRSSLVYEPDFIVNESREQVWKLSRNSLVIQN